MRLEQVVPGKEAAIIHAFHGQLQDGWHRLAHNPAFFRIGNARLFTITAPTSGASEAGPLFEILEVATDICELRRYVFV